jgi:hypothetical protein
MILQIFVALSVAHPHKNLAFLLRIRKTAVGEKPLSLLCRCQTLGQFLPSTYLQGAAKGRHCLGQKFSPLRPAGPGPLLP